MFWFFIGVLVGHGLFCAMVAFVALRDRLSPSVGPKCKPINVKYIESSYVIPVKRY